LGAIADKIRRAVREGRYVFGAHADERLRERRILGWQVVGGLDSAKLIHERPKAKPNPIAEFEQTLPDGTAFKSVWSWISLDHIAKLVTVHFFNG
jgi:hypothetical protein